MRVLIVSQYYLPEPAKISVDLAAELTKLGHEVKVLTGYPNYPKGEIYSGYRQKWRSNETLEKIEVCRVPIFIDHSQNAFRRMLNYVSFSLSSSTARNYARQADVIYVYATQMTAAFGPWLWRIAGGKPYVLHIQDLWPDSITGSSISGNHRAGKLISALLKPWIKAVYHHAGAVIAIAPTMAETLVSRGVNRNRVEMIYNWAGDPIEPQMRTHSSDRHLNGARILYAGNVGDLQDLETAVRAAARSADAGVELVIVGDGVVKAELVALKRELAATNVTFHNSVPRNEMKEIYESADFGLISLKDLPVFRGTIPSKFQAVLGHSLPVVTTVLGDVRRIVQTESLGFVADPQSVDSLEAAFRQAATSSNSERAEFASRAHSFSMQAFSKTASVAKIEEILQSVFDKEKK